MASSAPSTDPQVITFGCRLNSYESEVMRDHARSQGLQDAIIINTCAVTAEAERQARQSIRRLRRENPSALIIVTGCSVLDRSIPTFHPTLGKSAASWPQA